MYRVPTGPVFLFFPVFQRFSCFHVFFLFFTVCPVFFYFQVKILNFQVFFYSVFLQILETWKTLKNQPILTKSGKSQRKIQELMKVKEKLQIFFILKAVCIYFLSFLRMINFFLVYFLEGGQSQLLIFEIGHGW